MSYEIPPARELLPHYPDNTRTAYEAAGVGGHDWQDLGTEEKLQRLESTAGDTPLGTFTFDGLPGAVHAKLEHRSPTGSHCDRQITALGRMIRDGVIIPGTTTIREISSGSVGASLAIHAPLLGIAMQAVVPEQMEPARRRALTKPGVELSVVAGDIAAAATGVRTYIREMVAQGWRLQKHYTPDYRAIGLQHPDGPAAGHVVLPNHSVNPLTIDAVRPLGLEMARQLHERRVVLDAMLLVIGNGTSIHGVAPVIRQYQPQAAIYGIEDARDHPTYDRVYGIPEQLRNHGRHDTYGSSVSGTPVTYLAERVVDHVAIVAPQPRDVVRDRFNTDHQEIAVGNSTAMGLKVAQDIIANSGKAGAHIGMVCYDAASRYSFGDAANS